VCGVCVCVCACECEGACLSVRVPKCVACMCMHICLCVLHETHLGTSTIQQRVFRMPQRVQNVPGLRTFRQPGFQLFLDDAFAWTSLFPERQPDLDRSLNVHSKCSVTSSCFS